MRKKTDEERFKNYYETIASKACGPTSEIDKLTSTREYEALKETV